jgi:PilZ domain-containing protein
MPDTTEQIELDQKTQLRISILVLSPGSYSGSGFQYAIARNLGSRGALLDEVKYPVHPGDLLRIGYKKRRAKARVLWVCEVGDIQPFQVGIELLPDEPCPWTRELRALGSNQSYDGRDRRRHERVPIDLQININGRDAATHSIDISAGGLYVETSSSILVGTAVKLGIWLRKKRFLVNAIVRTVDPGIGMGVEFIGLCDADRKAIGELIERPLRTSAEDDPGEWSSEKQDYD